MLAAGTLVLLAVALWSTAIGWHEWRRVSGEIVDNLDEAVAAVQQIASLERSDIRRRFELRFTVERMARDYLVVYDSLSARESVGVDAA